MNILVVGAGITGLISGLALERDGHNVTIIEKESSYRALPTAVSLPQSSLRLLEALGIDYSAGCQISQYQTLDSAGRPLPTPITPALTILRPALHKAIIKRFGSNIEVIFATSIKRIRELPDRVTATWQGHTQEFDYVVGADGQNSAVRSRISGPANIDFAGHTVWRGITEYDLAGESYDLWDKKTRIQLTPLPNGKANYVISTKVKTAADFPKHPIDLDELTKSFKIIWPEVRKSISKTPPYRRNLYQMKHNYWGSQRIFLAGDAAHLSVPSLWYGGALAIEDAMALTIAIRRECQADISAQQSYFELREKRVRNWNKLNKRISRFQALSLPKLQYYLAQFLPKIYCGNSELLDEYGFELAQKFLIG